MLPRAHLQLLMKLVAPILAAPSQVSLVTDMTEKKFRFLVGVVWILLGIVVREINQLDLRICLYKLWQSDIISATIQISTDVHLGSSYIF